MKALKIRIGTLLIALMAVLFISACTSVPKELEGTVWKSEQTTVSADAPAAYRGDGRILYMKFSKGEGSNKLWDYRKEYYGGIYYWKDHGSLLNLKSSDLTNDEYLFEFVPEDDEDLVYTMKISKESMTGTLEGVSYLDAPIKIKMSCDEYINSSQDGDCNPDKVQGIIK